MDALKEIERFLAKPNAISGRKLSLEVAGSHAYISSLLKRRHAGNYDAAEKLARIIFPDEPNQQTRFIISLMAKREVALAPTG